MRVTWHFQLSSSVGSVCEFEKSNKQLAAGRGEIGAQ